MVVYITQQSFEIDILFVCLFIYLTFWFFNFYTVSIVDWFKVELNFLFLFHVRRGKALSFGSSIAESLSFRALALENGNAKSKGNLIFLTSKQSASGNGKQHYCKFFCNSATV